MLFDISTKIMTIVKKHMLTYVDQLDAVLLDGVEGDGDVLERVGLRLWPLVVAQLSLLQSLHEGN